MGLGLSERRRAAVHACEQLIPALLGRGHLYLVPAVVYHAIGHRIVVVGEQLVQVIAVREGDVVPEYRGAVPVYQLAQMRHRIGQIVRGHVLMLDEAAHAVYRALGLERPVEHARIVQAHLHAARPHRVGQLAHEVAAGEVVRPARVGRMRGPERVAVVMLGHQHAVLRARPLHEPGPVVHVERAVLLLKIALEVEIRPVAEMLFVERLRGRTRYAQRVEIPLGIRVVGKGGRHALGHLLVDVAGLLGRKRRYREQRPVYEYAELRVVIPLGHLVLMHGLKRRLVYHAILLLYCASLATHCKDSTRRRHCQPILWAACPARPRPNAPSFSAHKYAPRH